MRFEPGSTRRWIRSAPLRLAVIGIGWLVLIAVLHWHLNSDTDQRQVVRMGYMPVIANLAAPLIDHASADDGSIRFKAIKFASFAEMAEALRNDNIQAAFMIAPLAIVLRQQGEDVKVVYIGNRHESTLVVRKGLGARRLKDLDGRTIAVPMRYSGHNLGLLKWLASDRLSGRVKLVEMNPPDMAAALTSGSLDAYFVGEPFAAQTLKSGHADLLFHVEDRWPGFICNLLVVKQRFLDRQPEAAKLLVQGAARSGLWAQGHLPEAARIASQYWGQPLDLVMYALETPSHRIVFDQFVPRRKELQQLANLMHRFGLSATASIDGLVADRLARQVPIAPVTQLNNVLP